MNNKFSSQGESAASFDVSIVPPWLANTSCFILAEGLFRDLQNRLLKAGKNGKQNCSSPVADLLHDGQVARFLHLMLPTRTQQENSPRPDGGATAAAVPIWSAPVAVPVLTVKSAPAVAAVFYFVTMCNSLGTSVSVADGCGSEGREANVSVVTTGLYMECAALFLSLMRAVQTKTLSVRHGVMLESFLAFVVCCVVRMRRDDHHSIEGGKATLNRSPFDKFVVDDALSHALTTFVQLQQRNQQAGPSPSPPAEIESPPFFMSKGNQPSAVIMTPEEVVLAVVRGVSRGGLAVSIDAGAMRSKTNASGRPAEALSPPSTFVITQPLLLDLMSVAEAITDRHRRVAKDGGGNEESGAQTHFTVPLSQWTDANISILGEILTVFAVVDDVCASVVASRLERLLGLFADVECLLDSMQSTRELPSLLMTVTLMSSLRFPFPRKDDKSRPMPHLRIRSSDRLASSPGTPKIPLPSPSDVPPLVSSSGSNGSSNTSSAATNMFSNSLPQRFSDVWIGTLTDLDGMLQTKSTGTPSTNSATPSPSSSIQAPNVLLLLRMLNVFHAEFLRVAVTCSAAVSSNVAGQPGSCCSPLSDVAIAVLAIVCTSNRTSFHPQSDTIPPWCEAMLQRLFYSDDGLAGGGRSSGESDDLDGPPPLKRAPPASTMKPQQHATTSVSAAHVSLLMDEVVGLMQDHIRLLVSPTGAHAIVRGSMESFSESVSDRCFTHGECGPRSSATMQSTRPNSAGPPIPMSPRASSPSCLSQRTPCRLLEILTSIVLSDVRRTIMITTGLLKHFRQHLVGGDDDDVEKWFLQVLTSTATELTTTIFEQLKEKESMRSKGTKDEGRLPSSTSPSGPEDSGSLLTSGTGLALPNFRPHLGSSLVVVRALCLASKDIQTAISDEIVDQITSYNAQLQLSIASLATTLPSPTTTTAARNLGGGLPRRASALSLTPTASLEIDVSGWQRLLQHGLFLLAHVACVDNATLKKPQPGPQSINQEDASLLTLVSDKTDIQDSPAMDDSILFLAIKAIRDRLNFAPVSQFSRQRVARFQLNNDSPLAPFSVKTQSRVLQLLAEQFEEAVRSAEVIKRNGNASHAQTHTVQCDAIRNHPVLQSSYEILLRMMESVVAHGTCVMRFCDSDVIPLLFLTLRCSASSTAAKKQAGFTSSMGSRIESILGHAYLALKSNSEATQSMVSSMIGVILTLAWPGSGALGGKANGAIPLSVVATALETVSAPLLAVLSVAQQWLLLMERAEVAVRSGRTQLLSMTSSNCDTRDGGAPSSPLLTAKASAVLFDQWKSCLELLECCERFDGTGRSIDNAKLSDFSTTMAFAEPFALCEKIDDGKSAANGGDRSLFFDSSNINHPAEPAIDLRKRFRTLWTMLTLYGIVSDATKSAFNALRPVTPTATQTQLSQAATASGTDGLIQDSSSASGSKKRSNTLAVNNDDDDDSNATGTGDANWNLNVTSIRAVISPSITHRVLFGRRSDLATSSLGQSIGEGIRPLSPWNMYFCSTRRPGLSSLVSFAMDVVHRQGEPGANRVSAWMVSRLAVVTPPLTQLRSTDCQQAFADIATLERHLVLDPLDGSPAIFLCPHQLDVSKNNNLTGPNPAGGGGAGSTSTSPAAAGLVKTMVADLCRWAPAAAAWIQSSKSISFVEALFLRAIVNLEALRAASGCFHVSIQYAQVELREFVASKGFLSALSALLSTAVFNLFIEAIDRCPDRALATRALATDVVALIVFAAVGTEPVRAQSKLSLDALVQHFPHIIAEPYVLYNLLRILNVIQTHDEDEVTTFFTSEFKIQYIAIATSSAAGTERQAVHSALLTAAKAWVDVAKIAMPHRLFDTALQFTLENESVNMVPTSHYSGTELAMRCCSVVTPESSPASQKTSTPAVAASGNLDVVLGASTGVLPRESRLGIMALASSRLRNQAQAALRRSHAAGAVAASLRYAASRADVEKEVTQKLVQCVRASLGASSTTSLLLSEKNLLQLAERLLQDRGNNTSGADGLTRSPANSHAFTFQVATPSSGQLQQEQVSKLLDLFAAMVHSAALLQLRPRANASAQQHPLIGASFVSVTMRYLVQSPMRLFSAPAIHTAVGCWKWVLTEHTDTTHAGYLSPRSLMLHRMLLQNIVEAVEWTVSRRLGLFDEAPHAQVTVVESGLSTQEATRYMTRHTDDALKTCVDAPETLYASDYATNSPHKIVIAFLAEHFADSRLPVANDPVILRLLFRLASVWTRDPMILSQKDTSFSERFRGMLLVFHIIESIHKYNLQRMKQQVPVVLPFACLVTLRSRAYECLLRWFARIPASFVLTQEPLSVVKNELLVLEALVDILGREQDRLSASTQGFLPRSRKDSTVATADAVSAASTGVLRRRAAVAGQKSVSGTPVSDAYKRLHNMLGLCRFLIRLDAQRLAVWAHPRSSQKPALLASLSPIADVKLSDTSPALWKAYCDAALTASPEILIGFATRVSNPHVTRLTAAAVTNQPALFAHIPQAIEYYVHEGTLQAGLEQLYLFTNASAITSLRLLDAHFQSYPHVVRYAIRSLMATDSKHLIFYLPQLLQCLAHDRSGSIERFLDSMSKKSTEFTHQLLWCLQTEGDSTNQETELGQKCKALSRAILAHMNPEQLQFYEDEFRYVADITALSGILKPVEKPKRKEKLRQMLRDNQESFHDPIRVNQLYLPTNPDYRITKLIPHTAGAMQSAAKCPILVQFEVVPRDPEDVQRPVSIPLSETSRQRQHHLDPNGAAMQEDSTTAEGTASMSPPSMTRACIFKMGDDCRQDQIALQIISFIRRILNAVQLPCFLWPYRVVTTGQTSGIIECVPNAMSRDQIGKLVESNLAEYFVQTYGHPQSPAFRKARQHFVTSMASYSVASYVLNIKDRHNGNIMLDRDGHIIHIDFGFIFDYSPGGDMNFESSPFKLTQEMLQLMGDSVSGRHTVQSSELAQALVDAESYETYVNLVVKGYLAVKQHARQICVLVELMLNSGLPCFKPKKTIADLAERLSLHRTDVEAAAFMFDRVAESRDNMRTRLYDRYQNIAEGIEM